MSGGPNRERGTQGQGGATCSHFTARALPCVSVLHTSLSDPGQGAPRGRNDPQVTYVQLFNTSKNFLTVEPLAHANPSQDRDPTTSKTLAALAAGCPRRTQVLNSQDLLTSGKGQGECFSRQRRTESKSRRIQVCHLAPTCMDCSDLPPAPSTPVLPKVGGTHAPPPFSQHCINGFRTPIKIFSKYTAKDLTQLLTQRKEKPSLSTQATSTLTNANLTVKPAGPRQGQVKDVGAVGARQHHDARGRAEPWT